MTIKKNLAKEMGTVKQLLFPLYNNIAKKVLYDLLSNINTQNPAKFML